MKIHQLDLVKILPLNIEGIVINLVYDLESKKTKFHVYGNDEKNYICETNDLELISSLEEELDEIVENEIPSGKA